MYSGLKEFTTISTFSTFSFISLALTLSDEFDAWDELDGDEMLGVTYSSCCDDDCDSGWEPANDSPSFIPSNCAANCFGSTPWFDLRHFSKSKKDK